MLDPVVVDVAQMSPGVCFLCRTHNGPFVDTLVTAIEGRVYICAGTCGGQIAAMSGFVPGEDARRLGAAVDEAVGELEELRLALEVERESKVNVVSLDDALVLAGRNSVTTTKARAK